MEEKRCTALNVSDESLCQESATSLNGLFCPYHSKQCQGLYQGYKRRNARLDALKLPKYLKDSPLPLANETFGDVESKATVRELHDYLLLRYRLLTRVIGARNLHHSRFFSMNMDYGNQHYKDNLQNQRHIAARALESLGKRAGEMLFLQQEWFQWARQRQEEEEKSRDNEKKKIKREAALFKRYWSNLEARAKESRRKGDFQRQEQFLEEAYRERITLKDDEGLAWDPIDDVVEDERATYVEIINLFLMLKDGSPGSDKQSLEKIIVSKESAKKRKSQKPVTTQSGERADIETLSQMRKRLREGSTYSQGASVLVRGTSNHPIELANKTACLPDDEIDVLLKEVSEIKHLLFCRLLLSHAGLLPVAIRADSVEEFLNDADVKDADLRDICLKMENPRPQEVRDACADLFRNEDENRDIGTCQGELQYANAGDTTRKVRTPAQHNERDDLKPWMPKRSRKVKKEDDSRKNVFGRTVGPTEVRDIDFRVVDDQAEYGGQRIRVKICGRYIYNYPSEKSMSRGGWLHFCLIAKDSDLSDALKLCRKWDEFFELSILALYQYFPAANWISWATDREQTQLVTLGFFPYGEQRFASQITTTQNRQMRRNLGVAEARSFLAGSVKRNDQASRRLIKYLSMQTDRVLVLVRDATDGRILIQPPSEERWLLRRGFGRASFKESQEWIVEKEIGVEFFKELEKFRKWTVGFSEHFDIIVWDREAGLPFGHVYSTILEMLFKAHRCRKPVDTYGVAAPILTTLTRDENSHRSRGVKTGEKSFYDIYHDEGTRFTMSGPGMKSTEDIPRYLFYDDTDSLEDEVLFPEEHMGEDTYIAVGESTNRLENFEKSGKFDTMRFALDLDTDEELLDGEEDENEDEDGEQALQLDEEVDLDEKNDRLENGIVTDPLSPGRDVSIPDKSFGVSHGNELSLERLQHPMAKLCDDLQIPVQDIFVVAISRELGLPNRGSTKDLTIAENIAFRTLYAQYKSASNIGVGAFNAKTAPVMRKQYERFTARESSKFFKEAWHKADLEPGSRDKYFESATLIETARKFDQARYSFTYLIPLAFLRLQPLEHRRVIPDMRQAFTKMSLFFPYATDFLSSVQGEVFHNHMILDQTIRAANPPDRRSHQSNTAAPQSLWEEWDDIRRKRDCYPGEWNTVLRPMLARLYREGIIRNSYNPNVRGEVIAARESGRCLDLYCDFRANIEATERIAIDLEEPPTTDELLFRARQFAATHLGARFAFLRTWSSPHFYPLLIGPENRWELAFADGCGRNWEWKFVPKDMPYSEWSIHRQLKQRIASYQRYLGDNVVVKRDSLLVMAKNEDELLKLASAATYAVQTFDTWRLEIDLWRCFVNVDLGFLEGLDRRWID